MKIIISPAKKMNSSGSELLETTEPIFRSKAEELRERLRSMSLLQLRKLWGCSEKLAEENFQKLNSPACLTPALLAYEGIQYQYMAPQVFTQAQWDYCGEHLRILSGLYGVLRPTDGVLPYRLEMQAKLAGEGYRDLYGFWGDSLYREIAEPGEWILNLASREYSRTVEKYCTPDVPFITCIFGELSDGRVKTKATLAKMARGEMVRFLAEHQITCREDICQFTELGFAFDEKRSQNDQLVFIKSQGLSVNADF